MGRRAVARPARSCAIRPIGCWWAAVPKKNWPKDEDLVARIDKGWHQIWGDRRQELVFIGTRDMDKAAITAELNACLLQRRLRLLPTERMVETVRSISRLGPRGREARSRGRGRSTQRWSRLEVARQIQQQIRCGQPTD